LAEVWTVRSVVSVVDVPATIADDGVGGGCRVRRTAPNCGDEKYETVLACWHTHGDDDPRWDVGKLLSGDDSGVRDLHSGLCARLHEVHRHPAVHWPPYVRRDLDNASEGHGIANRSNALRAIAKIGPKVFTSPERAVQRLATVRGEGPTPVAFLAQGAVEMVTRVNVPLSITSWEHDEKLALPRSLYPECESEVSEVPDYHCVPMLTGDRLKLHQAHFGIHGAALPRFLEDAPPRR